MRGSAASSASTRAAPSASSVAAEASRPGPRSGSRLPKIEARKSRTRAVRSLSMRVARACQSAAATPPASDSETSSAAATATRCRLTNFLVR
jgi:hypothetical protein